MRWLRTLYILNGFAISSLYGFVPVLLQSRGFDTTLIGLTTGLGSLAYTFALPAWGHVGDIISGPRRTLQLACIPAAIFALGLSAPVPVVVIILCQVVMSAGGGPAMALTDAMTVPTLANPSRDYSRLRLLTSISAGGGGIGFGLLYSQTGYMAAPYIYAVVMAATVACVMFVPHGRDSERRRVARGAEAAREEERGRFGSVSEAFAISPILFGVLTSVTLIFLGVMGSATYIGIRISDLGGGATGVGFANGAGSLAEVPGLLVAGWLVARFGIRSVLAVSAFGFAACMAGWIWIVDPYLILVTRFISGIFFAGIFFSFVMTMARVLPQRLQATGQTLFQAACFGIAAVVSSVVGGVLYSTVGAGGVFGVGAVCAVAGGLLGLAVLAGREAAVVTSPSAA
jgi:MFS transporter, PPP family, 3-phenylpropionic acid transporter